MVNIAAYDNDDAWSEKDILRDWIEQIPKPGDDAVLNWDTLQDYKLYLINPEWTPKVGWSLWVEHDNGVEFPIIQLGMAGLNTSVVDGGEPPIEISDRFKDELYLTLHHYCLFPYDNLNEVESIKRFPTEYPDDMSELEIWAIDTIAHNFVSKGFEENYDHIPYELAWGVEDAIQYIEANGGA